MTAHVPIIASDFPRRYTRSEARQWEDHFISGYAILRRRMEKEAQKSELLMEATKEKQYRQILEFIGDRSRTFNEIADHMGIDRRRVSSLLRNMRNTGAIGMHGDGDNRIYEKGDGTHRDKLDRATDEDLRKRADYVLSLITGPVQLGQVMDMSGLSRMKAERVLICLHREGRLTRTQTAPRQPYVYKPVSDK